MSRSIPPVDPGGRGDEDRKQYPYPVPQWGMYPARAAPAGGATGEEAEVRRRDEEHRRQQDLVDFFGEARQSIRELLGDLRAEEATGSDRLHELADVVVAEVSRQIALERRYLVPLADEHLAGADADELRGELAEVEELVRQLYEHADGSPQEVTAAAEKLAERLDHRAQAQDRHLFPRLREAVDSDQLREQAQRAWAAKDGAPTRPHPRAPDRPPWSGVTDPVVGAADRIRDEVTGRPTNPYDIG